MLKYTTEQMQLKFKEQGCELLSEYKGCQVKMEYQCKCGRIAKITWNDFQDNKRCGYCHPTGRKKKYTFKEVKEIFKNRGCQLLEKEYKSVKTPMKYRCKCSRIAKITFDGFRRGQYCYHCGLEKNKGSNHHSWIKDRKQKRENDLFRKKCYKALSVTLKACGKVKVGRTSDMLGYGPKELQEYIKNHPNYNSIKNRPWHLDHIFPIMAFVEYGIKDLKIINALDNLQPMKGKENISKSDKYDKRKFLEWLETKGIILNENI